MIEKELIEKIMEMLRERPEIQKKVLAFIESLPF